MLSAKNIDRETIEKNRRPATECLSETLVGVPGCLDMNGPLSSWTTISEEMSKLVAKIPEALRAKASFRVYGQYPKSIMVSVTYERRETDDEVIRRLG